MTPADETGRPGTALLSREPMLAEGLEEAAVLPAPVRTARTSGFPRRRNGTTRLARPSGPEMNPIDGRSHPEPTLAARAVAAPGGLRTAPFLAAVTGCDSVLWFHISPSNQG